MSITKEIAELLSLLEKNGINFEVNDPKSVKKALLNAKKHSNKAYKMVCKIKCLSSRIHREVIDQKDNTVVAQCPVDYQIDMIFKSRSNVAQ